MRLFLLRHADATHGFPDEGRALSAKGVKQIQKLAHSINPKAIEDIQNIWHSPLLRAKQTAALFAENFDIDCAVSEHEELIPGGVVESLAYELETLNGDTLLVGHNPHMEALTSFLLKRDSHPSMITFKKAGIVCLEYCSHPDQSWILQWYASPCLLSWFLASRS